MLFKGTASESGYNRGAVGNGLVWCVPKVVFGAALSPKTTVGLEAGTSSMFKTMTGFLD
jgi:hypothetical protein